MSKALVVGLRPDSALAEYLSIQLSRRELTAVYLDAWHDWRISVFANPVAYDLFCERDQLRVSGRALRLVLFFGMPEVPTVAAQDRYYQMAEYDALLFGLFLLVAPVLASRWSYLAAGYTDNEQRWGDSTVDPLGLGHLCDRLFRRGIREALIYGSTLVCRTADGETTVQALSNSLSSLPLPITLQLDPIRRTFIPFVGMLPRWLSPSATQIEPLLDWLFVPKGESIVRVEPVPSRLPTESFDHVTVVAHSRDLVAAHLLHRAMTRRTSAALIDLTQLYSSACSDEQFDAAIDTIRDAACVFARPLLVIQPFSSTESRALFRHSRILRILQQRNKLTLNPAAAGHTNLSKSAHGIYLASEGLTVPPTVATNDPAAALAFIEEHSIVVYKSGSGLRSFVARVCPEDLTRLDLLWKCPTLFQKFVDGANCRVHIVFGQALPLLIETPDVDHRQAFNNSRVRPHRLDTGIATVLMSAADRSGLRLCGCDLRWSSESQEWLTLEINRMPAIDFYDHVSGNQVADCILRRS